MIAATRRFYWGETNVDFVGRWRAWLLVSGILVLVSLASLFARGLNLSIEFKGGTAWIVDQKDFTVADAKKAIEPLKLGEVVVQTVGDNVRIESKKVEPAQQEKVSDALAEAAKVKAAAINVQSVGASWGAEVSRKAIQALIVFLVLVTIYISFRFEPKMAATALVELTHDIVIVVGVYSVTGFRVSPATVIGVLTILGYSLYDAVVVFDKVKENSPLLAGGKVSYSELVNISMNEVVARSMATSLTSLLPVGSLLFIGSFLLGAVSLRDLSLALFIGIASGAYSSVFVASPILARWKEREPRYQQARARAEAKRRRDAGEVSAKPMTKGEAEAELGAGTKRPGGTAKAAAKPNAGAGAKSAGARSGGAKSGGARSGGAKSGAKGGSKSRGGARSHGRPGGSRKKRGRR